MTWEQLKRGRSGMTPAQLNRSRAIGGLFLTVVENFAFGLLFIGHTPPTIWYWLAATTLGWCGIYILRTIGRRPHPRQWQAIFRFQAANAVLIAALQALLARPPWFLWLWLDVATVVPLVFTVNRLPGLAVAWPDAKEDVARLTRPSFTMGVLSAAAVAVVALTLLNLR